MILCFLAIAGFLIFSQPISFYDSQNISQPHRFQWLIAEVVVEHQAACLQFCMSFRRRWVYLPLSDVLSVEHRDEKYRLLLRRYRQQVCLIRTRDRTYAVGSQLRPFAQKWLATELADLLAQKRDIKGDNNRTLPNVNCSSCTFDKSNLYLVKTGALGFEPRNGGTKTRCLTTWRRPTADRKF